MQLYKGDSDELKMIAVTETILLNNSQSKDAFLLDAYNAEPLGDLISNELRSPLAKAIPLVIFRNSFKEIFDAFVKVGSFEAYLTVFRKIFGETVDVDFTVPAAGKLTIDITSDGVELTNFITRYIQDNAYLFDNIVDDVDDQIVFQTIKGFQSQYELERMLFEMVPAGIFTDISLTIGV